jgi:uncharacterized membrane protein YjjB (DUF3815 family)
MMSGALPLEWLIPTSLLGGLLLASVAKWRIWVAAVAIAILALIVGAMLHPMSFEIGNAIAAFLAALAGAALSSIIHRKRTA